MKSTIVIPRLDPGIQVKPIATLFALLLASAGANATDSGVCQVCPTGFDCSSGAPAIGGANGQILVRTATGVVWKNVAEVAAQGPQGVAGAQGATGARGATGPKGPPG